MNEIYSETYLKAKPPAKRRFVRGLLITVAVIVLLIGFLVMMLIGSMLPFLIMILVAVICFFVMPTKKIAFEYIFVDGQIDFDRILKEEKRKTMKRIDMSKVEVIAPEKSYKLDPYKNAAFFDFSSGFATDKHYIAVLVGEKGTEKIRFTPDENMLEKMRMKSPSKVSAE